MIELTGAFIRWCFIVFFAFWLITAFRAKRSVERRWGWSLVPILILAVYEIAIRAGLPVAPSNAELWPRTIALGVVADVVTLAGLIVLLWARVTIGTNWSGAVALKENHELIRSGPYARVRHPIYSGILLMGVGAALWYGHVAGLVLLALGVVSFWFKARSEERLLVSHFGEQYPAYRAQTGAFVPRLFTRRSADL